LRWHCKNFKAKDTTILRADFEFRKSSSKSVIQYKNRKEFDMRRHSTYSQTIHIGGASPRETEILAFGLCNTRLKNAGDSSSRIDALNKTHQLWSILVRDLSGDANKLPEDLKRQLVDLGFWAMSYSVAAMGSGLSTQPLIDVNQNILDGLKLQQQAHSPKANSAATSGFVPAQA
jgi:flagellar protein FlaF